MIVKDTQGFQLRATVTKFGKGLHSLELHQHWPQAQRPEWRRITQLTLSESQLDALAAVLIRRAA